MDALTDDLLIKVVSYITDPVTTTDELIPSGEASSYRSNPLRLSEFTLSRKDPEYVGRAKAVQALEAARKNGKTDAELQAIYQTIAKIEVTGKTGKPENAAIGSAVYAHKPGDGSAREQAASCQRVLGASANLAREYATKRYRSNLINWGIIPFVVGDETAFRLGDYVYFPGIRKAILDKQDNIRGYVIESASIVREISVSIGELTDSERQILVDGCLINYYRRR
jgi:aconitate hydratase